MTRCLTLNKLELRSNMFCEKKDGERSVFTACHKITFHILGDFNGGGEVHKRTITFSYMEYWSHQKVSRGPHKNPKDLRRRMRCLMVSLNPPLLPLSHTWLHNIKIAQLVHLLKQSHVLKRRIVLIQAMCTQPEWLADFQLFRGDGGKWRFGSAHTDRFQPMNQTSPN